MSDIALHLSEPPEAEDLEALHQGIRAYNAHFVPRPDWRPFLVSARFGGEMVGACEAQVGWSWIRIRNLWVAESHRGTGIGSHLLRRAEEHAVSNGCVASYLSTFDFQAAPFYLSQGYREFGTLDGYPPGHRLIFLRKALDPSVVS